MIYTPMKHAARSHSIVKLDHIQLLSYLEKGYIRLSNIVSDELTEDSDKDLFTKDQKYSKIIRAVRESMSKNYGFMSKTLRN